MSEQGKSIRDIYTQLENNTFEPFCLINNSAYAEKASGPRSWTKIREPFTLPPPHPSLKILSEQLEIKAKQAKERYEPSKSHFPLQSTLKSLPTPAVPYQPQKDIRERSQTSVLAPPRLYRSLSPPSTNIIAVEHVSMDMSENLQNDWEMEMDQERDVDMSTDEEMTAKASRHRHPDPRYPLSIPQYQYYERQRRLMHVPRSKMRPIRDEKQNFRKESPPQPYRHQNFRQRRRSLIEEDDQQQIAYSHHQKYPASQDQRQLHFRYHHGKPLLEESEQRLVEEAPVSSSQTLNQLPKMQVLKKAHPKPILPSLFLQSDSTNLPFSNSLSSETTANPSYDRAKSGPNSTNRSSLPCRTCIELADKPNKLEVHKQSHNNKKRHECKHPDCIMAFTTPSNMMRHYRKAHPEASKNTTQPNKIPKASNNLECKVVPTPPSQ